ncbi:formin-like protein 7 [Dorcoceras hygrometricum]|uniref:Formin-like protein 7 n=1 Tax=Dorcoceras hygrometricum TaxID=472368 RepID=A0A2Z7ADW4_9LAMI|nr:formin-like protein 7 [Dorcoceras hygrometricum]
MKFVRSSRATSCQARRTAARNVARPAIIIDRRVAQPVRDVQPSSGRSSCAIVRQAHGAAADLHAPRAAHSSAHAAPNVAQPRLDTIRHSCIDQIRALALIPLLGNHGGSRSHLPARQRKNKIWAGRRSIQFKIKHAMTIHRVFLGVTLLATRAWLRPVSRGNRHFTVGGGRLRQSGPRPDGRLLRQRALEGLTRSARTDSPRQVGRNKFRRERRRRLLRRGGAAATRAFRVRVCCKLFVIMKLKSTLRSHTPQNYPQVLNTLSSVSVRESGIQYLCDPQWFRDTASRGPTTIAAPESQFRTCPSDHDSIGYPRMSVSGESSTTMYRLLHASGSHPIPPPNDPKTNQYNQDLGLIHSTNGNHLESPNEGSSIDHQVTIYMHAQNITMFPTNETWYFASQILVSISGGLILILTAQSTRN